MALKDNIKNKRLQMGYTLEELGEKIGVSKQTIQKYENGIISNIPIQKIEALAHCLQTTPTELLGWTNEQKQVSELIKTNKYENITALLDQLNQKGIDEAERHTKYLTTQEEYKKNNTKSSTKTIKLKTAEEITSSRLAAFGGMVEDENLRQKLIDQAEKQRQENKPE
nr:MAG TPA: Helix-turn-helix XRE-family like protein [Caudoviricetes sp.]